MEKSYQDKVICPFQILREYLQVRPKYDTIKEQFFVFRDRSPLKPDNVCTVLWDRLQALGLDAMLYNTHSFRAGCCVDLHKLGVDLNFIKIFGRWKSNAVFTYLKDL